MPESSRTLPKSYIETQARMLGLDLSVIDADALLERFRSGLKDLDGADEICPSSYEPAVIFDSGSATR